MAQPLATNATACLPEGMPGMAGMALPPIPGMPAPMLGPVGMRIVAARGARVVDAVVLARGEERDWLANARDAPGDDATPVCSLCQG